MRLRPLCWYESVAILVGALGGAALMAHIGGWPKWLAEIDGATWAGWVQAIGSIAAIVGAAKLAERARQEGIEDRRRDLLHREIKTVNRVMSAVEITLNRVAGLRLLLEAEYPAPTVDSIEKVKDCLPMLKAAFDGVDEAGGIWALGQMLLQQVPPVVRSAQEVAQHPNLATDLNDDEFVDAFNKLKPLRESAHKAVQNACVALESGEVIIEACRAFIANPANLVADEHR